MSGKTAGKRIENDEEHQKSLDWLVLTSIELEDPLLGGADRERKQKIYDYVSQLVQAYRSGELAQMFPGLRQIYADLGWNYDHEPKQADPEPPQPEIELEPPKKTVNISAWLDDDD